MIKEQNYNQKKYENVPESVGKSFSLWCSPHYFLAIFIQYCVALPLQFFVTGFFIIMSPFWSSLLFCLVLICRMLIGQSVIYTQRFLFQNIITHIIIITICVYCNFKVL